MYGRKPMADAYRALRAILSNQVARLAPRLYVGLTGQTGRGSEPETTKDVSDYFKRCFHEYFQQLGVRQNEIPEWLKDKHLLEYGPGDVPGVGLLMLSYGARKVTCVDRFELASSTPKQLAVLRQIIEDLEEHARERAFACFNIAGDPASGFDVDRLEYVVTRDGLSGLVDRVDMVYSRAVLEHVNDLDATFDDMDQALKPGGVMVHQVDLKSHGLHRENPLDFLTWPVWLWKIMYSGKGVPNRWRIDRYRSAICRLGFDVSILEPTSLAKIADLTSVRPYLAKPFCELDDQSLAWLGFWLVARKLA
jgi:SAM-dependent methyltransferase